MKKCIYSLFFALVLSGVGCDKFYHLPAAPVPAPTPTPTSTASPTPNLTPVCTFTPLGIGLSWTSGTKTTFVIQNPTQWAAVNGTGAALPAVDFSKQMVLEVSEFIYVSCGCFGNAPSITSVCTYSDHIEVDYQHGGSTCPPPIGPPFVTCNSFLEYYLQDTVAVVQSGLPVTWIAH